MLPSWSFVLKRQFNEIFDLQFFLLHNSSLPGPLTNGLKYFRLWFRFRWVIWILDLKNWLPWEPKICLILELFKKMQNVALYWLQLRPVLIVLQLVPLTPRKNILTTESPAKIQNLRKFSRYPQVRMIKYGGRKSRWTVPFKIRKIYILEFRACLCILKG